MFIKDQDFQVEFTNYAEKHFCKSFFKKYKSKKWIETKKTIKATLKRAYRFQETQLIDNLAYQQAEDAGIFKLDFAVAGTHTAPKTSGNRVIFAIHHATNTIKILLVYSKTHCPKNKSETTWIFEEIKENFREYRKWV